MTPPPPLRREKNPRPVFSVFPQVPVSSVWSENKIFLSLISFVKPMIFLYNILNRPGVAGAGLEKASSLII